MRRMILVCVAVIAALVVGCAPDAGQAAKSPIGLPTVPLMCTPEQGGEAETCTEAEHDAMVARDRLCDEAELVLSRYDKEYERLAREGSEASEELLSYAAGDFVEETRKEFSQGLRLEGGEFQTLRVDRLVGESTGGSVVALQTCVNGTSVTIKKGDETIGKGRVAEERYYFVESLEGLKIVAVRSEEVPSC